MSAEQRTGEGSDLRAAFIRAAREILDERDTGLDLRKVAERAGKSRTAPYLVFGRTEEGGGLEALRLAVAVSGFGDMVAELEAARASTADPEAALRRVAAGYLDFALRHSRLLRLMFGPEVARAMRSGAGPGSPRPEAAELVRARADMERHFREVVTACQEVGAMEAGDARNLVLGAWAMFHGAAMLLLDGQLGVAGVGDPAEAAALVTPFLMEEQTLPVAQAAATFAAARVEKGFALRESVGGPVREVAVPARLAEPEPRYGRPERATLWTAEPDASYGTATQNGPAFARTVLSGSPALRMHRVLEGSRILWVDDRPKLSEQRATVPHGA